MMGCYSDKVAYEGRAKRQKEGQRGARNEPIKLRCKGSADYHHQLSAEPANGALPQGLANVPRGPTGATHFVNLGLWVSSFSESWESWPSGVTGAWTPTEALGDPGVEGPLFLRGWPIRKWLKSFHVFIFLNQICDPLRYLTKPEMWQKTYWLPRLKVPIMETSRVPYKIRELGRKRSEAKKFK